MILAGISHYMKNCYHTLVQIIIKYTGSRVCYLSLRKGGCGTFNPILHGLFLNHQSGGGGGGGLVVIAPMIMKFGTGIKLDVFYTVVTKSL